MPSPSFADRGAPTPNEEPPSADGPPRPSTALMSRTLSQCDATVLSVLEEVDEDGRVVSRRYQLAHDGRRLGAPAADLDAAEAAFLREVTAAQQTPVRSRRHPNL